MIQQGQEETMRRAVGRKRQIWRYVRSRVVKKRIQKRKDGKGVKGGGDMGKGLQVQMRLEGK